MFAQNTVLKGTAYDADTRGKMKLVFVNNLTQKEVDHTGQKGDFNIKAEIGDLVVFSCPGYVSDTIIIESLVSKMVVMKPKLILLNEVVVRAKTNKPENLKKEYAGAYSTASTQVLSADGSFSLNNLLSKQSQQKRAFRKFIDSELNERVIDRRFNRDLVSNLTHIKGQVLEDFISFYRPTFSQISAMDDVKLSQYIIKSYNDYIKLPAEARIYPPLPATTYGGF